MTEPVAINVTDMHTGGEPVRIIDARDPASGWPPVQGASILEKRAHAKAVQDHLRKFLMFEPRGHHDMYGALIVPPSLPGADFGALFMHNEGWSTMCGHAVIALGRFAVEQGWVKPAEPVTRVGIECPCGLVMAEVQVQDGRPGAVAFSSVPSFLFARDETVILPGHGAVTFDIAYGGAFYCLVPASAFGLEIGRDPVRTLVDAADALTQAAKRAVRLAHPESDDLAFLYGTILTDGGNGRVVPTRNVCVFADREVDRSPTGSGVTARMAAMHARGEAEIGEMRMFESITGARFTAVVEGSVPAYPRDAVTVRVGGMAHHSGTARFVLEPGDPLGGGFLLR